MNLTQRLAELTDAATAAIRSSTIANAELVTVGNSGADFISSRSPAAGALIIYPFPRVTFVAPRGIRRVEWTIGIVAKAGDAIASAQRCAELLEVVSASGLVSWRAAAPVATPTDFAVSEDPASPKIPGWAITITEEHLP